ncbi:MAG: GDYXXLXY domain-containing protein [SAR202 cluster bacterium]|nr:GDYXXLXY domain-containing protein [SAR202 cluster bacterium]|tara:strand:+ start:3888 stop:4556 length:669 start_codon:yes stop_codon:yes gene_type:complete
MNHRMKVVLGFIILLQVLSLVGFVIYQENLKGTGRKIILQTIPVDPRDLLRGEYVDLRYEISDITLENIRCYRLCLDYDLGDTSNRPYSRKEFLNSVEGKNIYLLLTRNPYKVESQNDQLDRLWYVYDINDSYRFDNKPEGMESVVIKGNIDEVEEIFTEVDSFIRIGVDYGIEQYFLQEGKGKVVEDATEVKVEVNIANNGKAFISDIIVDGNYFKESVTD